MKKNFKHLKTQIFWGLSWKFKSPKKRGINKIKKYSSNFFDAFHKIFSYKNQFKKLSFVFGGSNLVLAMETWLESPDLSLKNEVLGR